MLDLPGDRRWAIEVKRGTAPTLARGFHAAPVAVRPDAAFVVYAGDERYPKGDGVEAIEVRELAGLLAVMA